MRFMTLNISTHFEYSPIHVRLMSFVLVMLLSRFSLNRNSIVWIWNCNVQSVCHGHFYLKVRAFIESNVPKLDTIQDWISSHVQSLNLHTFIHKLRSHPFFYDVKGISGYFICKVCKNHKLSHFSILNIANHKHVAVILNHEV